jgi:hypothetical protein
MNTADLALARIEAIVADIEATERALGLPVRQPSDREALDVLARIIRKRKAKPHQQAAE